MPKRPPAPSLEETSQLAKAVAGRLRVLLDVVGWSQAQVVQLLQEDQSSVSKWVRGERLQPVYHMATLCDQAGCSLDFLYRGKIGSTMREDLALRLAAALPHLVEGSLPSKVEHRAPAPLAKAKAEAP